MKKRILSLITAISLIVSALPIALSAADTQIVVQSVSDTAFAAADGSEIASSNASVVDANRFVHVYNRTNNTEGLILSLSPDFSAGQTYTVSFKIRCANDLWETPTVNAGGGALAVYSNLGRHNLINAAYGGWGGTIMSDTAWQMFSFKVTSAQAENGVADFIIRAATSTGQAEPFDIDDIVVTCDDDGAFRHEYNFDSIAVGSIPASLDDVLSIGATNSATAKIAEDEPYFTDADSAGIVYTDGETMLSPGKYTLTGEFREKIYNRAYSYGTLAENMNRYTLTCAVKTADGDYSSGAVTVSTEWTDFKYSFTLLCETVLSEISFAADHAIDGVSASVDFRNIVLSCEASDELPINGIEASAFTDITGAPIYESYSNPAFEEGNNYLHVTDRKNNGYGLILYTNLDYSDGKTYTLSFRIRGSNNIRRLDDSRECGAIRLLGYNGCPAPTPNFTPASWGSPFWSDEWVTYSYTLTEASTVLGRGIYLFAGSSSNDSIDPYDIDNVVVTCSDRTVVYSQDFDSLAANTTPRVLKSSSEKVWFGVSVDEMKMLVKADESYRTANNTTGIVIDEIGSALVPGKYTLTGMFRNSKFRRGSGFTDVGNNNCFTLTAGIETELGTYGIQATATNVTNEWTKFEYTIRVAEETTLESVMFKAEHAVDGILSSIDFKDISLTYSEDDSTDGEINLGILLVLLKKISIERETPVTPADIHGIFIEQEASTAMFAGNSTYTFTADEEGNYITVSGRQANWAYNVVNTGIPVEAGKMYKITYSIRTEDGASQNGRITAAATPNGDSVKLKMPGEGSDRYEDSHYNQYRIPSEWRTVRFEYTAEATGTLYLNFYGGTGGEPDNLDFSIKKIFVTQVTQ